MSTISSRARFTISKYSSPFPYAGKPGGEKSKFNCVRCVGTGVDGFSGICRRIDSFVFVLLSLVVSVRNLHEGSISRKVLNP